MELERDMLVSPAGEVPVIEGELVTAIRTLAGRGVGKKAIAREVGVAVNTVRRYLRDPITPGQQIRPAARRLIVKAFLNERGDDWREGIAAGFTHFGGLPRTLLGDNARALVLGRDRATGTVSFHPTSLAFCRDWDVQPRACAPYRARTKGKTEAGVKYVKRNALGDQAFESFGALEQHLAEWMTIADQRRHGTTREAPLVRFTRDERAALRALPIRALPRRTQ